MSRRSPTSTDVDRSSEAAVATMEHPLYIPIYLARWRPNPGWASFVRPAWERLSAPDGSLTAVGEDAWRQLAIMLGDTGACPLCILAVSYAQEQLGERVEDRGLQAHLQLCMLDLGLARTRNDEPLPLGRAGDPDLIEGDPRPDLAAWLARQLEPVQGDLARAAALTVRLAASRTGIAAGPARPTVEQLLDPTLWEPAAEREEDDGSDDPGPGGEPDERSGLD